MGSFGVRSRGSSPKRFSPSVPARQPVSTNVQIGPTIGINPMRIHQADLSRSCQRLAWAAREGHKRISIGIRDLTSLLRCRMSMPRRRLRMSQIRPAQSVKAQKGCRLILPLKEKRNHFISENSKFIILLLALTTFQHPTYDKENKECFINQMDKEYSLLIPF